MPDERPGLIRRIRALKPGFLTVFIAVVGVYWFTQPPEYMTTDGAIREFVGRNIWYEHDFALRQIEDGQFLNNMYEYGPDGRPYAYFGIGQSLMQMPFLLILDAADALGVRQYLSPSEGIPAMLAMLAASGLIVAFIFGAARALGYEDKTALRTALLAGFAGILWPLSRQSFDMVQEAMGVTGAVMFILAARRSGRRRWLGCAAGGVLYGAALATRVSAAIAAPALALLLLGPGAWDGWGERLKAAGWFALGVLSVAWLVPFYNAIRFGSPFVLGYANRAPYPGGALIPGIAGWLVSPWRGALIYMPLLLMLPFGWRRFAARDRLAAWSLAALFASYLVFHAALRGLGTVSWGPYYLLPGIVPLYLIFAGLLDDWRALPGWTRGAMIALTALTVLIQVPAMINPPERYQSVMAVRGISVLDEGDIWNWRWNPLTLQAEGFVENVQNLPRWRQYTDPPTEYDAETLLRELPVYLLPDWRWFQRLVRDAISGLTTPVLSLICGVWLFVQAEPGRRRDPAPDLESARG
jgi:hypothetical protein